MQMIIKQNIMYLLLKNDTSKLFSEMEILMKSDKNDFPYIENTVVTFVNI